MACLFSVLSCFARDYQAHTADLIIFSYNRPMQLYCLLESVGKYVTGIAGIHVIYRADEAYEKAYREVKKEFQNVAYYCQGNNPRSDFKPLTEHAAFNSASPYIIFTVDDTIVKNYINVSECIDLLERTQSYGFYFRLGKNLSECYMRRCFQPLPPLTEVVQNVYSWTIKDGLYDWQYPNTLDMTLYRKNDIQKTICSLNYYSPNTLEATWHHRHREVIQKTALCYGLSAIVNVPMNLVQHDYHNNRHMAEIPASQLLDIFNRGFKIDSTPLHQIANKGAHMEYVPTYVLR